MALSSHTALVADIGGTHARFALMDIDTLTHTDFTMYRVVDFPSLQAAVAAYLATTAQRPSIGAFAVAGPVNGPTITLTNSGWSFSRDAVRTAAGLDTAVFLNDFEAVARSLPHLGPSDLRQIGGDPPAARATKAAVGPGTGLGVAGLSWSDAGWTPLPSEGGHISAAAETLEEFTILETLRDGLDHLSVERLVSGPGLVALYGALCKLRGKTAATLTASEITQRGLQRTDGAATEALERFVAWLGRFTGDAALFLGASGGVYLGGGIPPKIVDALMRGAMREAFERKGRMSAYVRQIPIYVIMAADAGLRGAAVALRRP